MSTTDTFVQYTDSNGKERTKKTKFGPQTNLSNVRKWISGWRRSTGTYELEIKDQHGRYVDFDDGYILDFRPFGVSEPPQPSTLITLEIELRIVDTDDDSQSLTTQVTQTTSSEKPSASMHQQHLESTSIAEQPNSNVQHETLQNRVTSLRASNPVTIDQKNAEMEFTKNVNDIQRDQHVTDFQRNKCVNDTTSAVTSEKIGSSVKIQGDKTGLQGTANHGSVNPKLKVSKAIPDNERRNWKLLIFLVYEICQNGKRIFYHNEERQFIINDNAKMEQSTSSLIVRTPNETGDRNKSRREPIILNLNDSMFSEHGEELVLKTIVVPHSKTDPIKIRYMFCELTNEYPSNISYETTRLACMLVKNDDVLWDHLIFSNAMIFPQSTNDLGDIYVKDNNNCLIEKIPVRIMKRKMDFNQSDNVIKRPPRIKKAKQKVEQTAAPDTEFIQDNQAQMTSMPFQNQFEYSMPANEEQFQYLNDLNDYGSSHPMASSQSTIENSSYSQYITPLMTMNNFTNGILLNQSAATDMNSYGYQTEKNTEDIEMFTPTTSSQSEVTNDSNHFTFQSYQQRKISSQESLPLPSMQSFLKQPITNDPLKETFLSDDNEDFTDTGEPY